MSENLKAYLMELLALVGGAFVGSLATGILAAEAFDVWEYDWPTALKVAASLAVVALAKGVIGRFRGDPSTVSWRKP